MAFTIRRAAAVAQSAKAIQGAARQILSDNPIVFSSAARATGEIRERSNPIECIGLELEINYTQTGAALVADGPWNLIRNLKLLTDSEKVLVSVPGFLLPHVHQEYALDYRLPYFEGLTLGASGTIRGYIEIPMDVGGYMSLLDASGVQSLNVEIEWGTAAELFTGGTSSITSAKITPRTTYIRGIPRNEPGGLGYPYFRNKILAVKKPINQTQNDFEVELLSPERVYHGLTVFQRSGSTAAFVDGLADNLTLRRGGLIIERVGAFFSKAKQDMQYVLSAAQNVGVLRLPFVEEGHIEHVQTAQRGETMQLLCDVTNTGTSPHLYLVSHYFGD